MNSGCLVIAIPLKACPGVFLLNGGKEPMSSQIIIMPVGIRKGWEVIEWQICSAPLWFISQPRQHVQLTEALCSSCTCMYTRYTYAHTTPLLRVLWSRLSETFLCPFNVCGRELSWLCRFTSEKSTKYRKLSLGSVSSFDLSPSIFFAFHQPSSTGVIISICPCKFPLQGACLKASHAAWKIALQINMSRKFYSTT